MRLELMRDPERFAARTRALLAGRIECNVLATVLMSVLDGPRAATPPVFAVGSARDGRAVWAALRVPPWPMLAGELEPEQAPAAVAAWLDDDPAPGGVNAVTGTARAIAQAWSGLTGGSTRCRTRMSMHALEAVIDPPRPARGPLRVCTVVDRPRLLAWWEAFVRDAGVLDPDHAVAVDSRLEQGRLLMWDDGGPVSMVGINRPVAGVVRIGPVYTPDALRRRGYAGTAVAAVSRRALAAGAQRCLLYTDVANPTSNKIYAEVGYRRLGGWEKHEFLDAETGAGL